MKERQRELHYLGDDEMRMNEVDRQERDVEGKKKKKAEGAEVTKGQVITKRSSGERGERKATHTKKRKPFSSSPIEKHLSSSPGTIHSCFPFRHARRSLEERGEEEREESRKKFFSYFLLTPRQRKETGTQSLEESRLVAFSRFFSLSFSQYRVEKREGETAERKNGRKKASLQDERTRSDICQRLDGTVAAGRRQFYGRNRISL